MKKLSLLKLNEPKVLREEELKNVKGGECSAWLCDCSNGWGSYAYGSIMVDNTLEHRDRDGLL